MDTIVSFGLGVLASPYILFAIFLVCALIDCASGTKVNRNVSFGTWVASFAVVSSLGYMVYSGQLEWWKAVVGIVVYLIVGFVNAVFWWKSVIRHYVQQSRKVTEEASDYWASRTDVSKVIVATEVQKKTQRFLEERLNLDYGNHKSTAKVYFLLWFLSAIGNVVGILVSHVHAYLRQMTVRAINKEMTNLQKGE